MSKKMQDLDEILKGKEFMKQVLQKGAGLVRQSNALPQNEEMKYYMNNQQLKQKQKAINTKILQQIKQIAAFTQFENVHAIDLNHFANVIALNDQLFENIDTSLDRIKKINNVTESSLFDPSKVSNSSSQFDQHGKSSSIEESGEDIIALATKEKPQNHFKECIDTSYLYPFMPTIKAKVNAEVPLDDVIVQVNHEGPLSFFKSIEAPADYEFPHPYAYEIENLVYSENQLATENIIIQGPSSLKNELIFVNTESLLDQLIEDLKKSSEVAIDLEHHSNRSFNGITCLIQISSRTQDYIVDVFPLWQCMHKLNQITTNPNIVKVLHGADMDIQWLQRDFGVYIVNLFDSGQAARMLSMPSYALAYLLQSICKVPTDKKYQLADWRIRPLPREMISYARSDTHYLLQIYDELRQQLVEKATRSGQSPSYYIEGVLNKSKIISLKKYIKPYLKDEKYHSILSNQRIILSDRKFRILKKLLEWRFINASKYDENPTFVLSNDLVFQIVNRLPVTLKELTASFLKLSYVAQSNASEIVAIIRDELESPQEQPSSTQNDNQNQFQYVSQKVNRNRQVIFSQEQVSQYQQQVKQYVQKSDNKKTQMEEEKAQPIKSSNSINYSTSFSKTYTIQQQEQTEEISFKLETFHIQIGVYQGNMHILEDHYTSTNSSTTSKSNKDTQIQDKLSRINSSFAYSDPVEFYCEKYPFMREAYELAKLQEQEIIKKRNDLAYIQRQSPDDLANPAEVNLEDENRDEYLAFIKEKGPSSKPKEIDQIKFPDLPLSYEDQFKTNVKKRKYNFGNNQNQPINDDDEEEIEENENGEKIYKKRAIGQKSTFDMLIEQEFAQQSDSNEDDEEAQDEAQQQNGSKTKLKKKKRYDESEKKQMQEDFDQLADKIKNQINKEPRFKAGINQRNNKRGQNNKGNNKFINKFKKSGF